MIMKKIIVPKGENPIQHFERMENIMPYFDSKLLSWIKNNSEKIGCQYHDNNEYVTIIRNSGQKLVFSNGYGILYHKLLKMGEESFLSKVDDRREIVLFASGE